MWIADRLVNLISGLGTSKDKATANAFDLTVLARDQLDAAYRANWLARKIVDIIPHDMTREWRAWQVSETEIEKLEAVEKSLQVRAKVARALQRARHYGGAALYIGTGDLQQDEEMRVGRIGQGGVTFLHVFHRWQIGTGEIDRNPKSPWHGEPSWYEVPRGRDRASVRVHPSRMIRFVGASLPDDDLSTDGWGDSVLQSVYGAVQNAASAQDHVAALLPEAKLDIIRVPGLSEHLSTTQTTDRLTKRFVAAGQLKSLINALLLEGSGYGDGAVGETWEQKQINFAAFPDLMRHYMDVAAGAADIPVTRLLGKAPNGLNASADGEFRAYYDNIAARQNIELGPALERLDEALIRSALGARPPQVHSTFNPLWQMSEAEKATVAKARAETTQIYAVNGTVPSPVLEKAVRNQLVESGVYPGIEKAYEEFDAGLLVEEDDDEDDALLGEAGEGEGEEGADDPSFRGRDESA